MRPWRIKKGEQTSEEQEIKEIFHSIESASNTCTLKWRSKLKRSIRMDSRDKELINFSLGCHPASEIADDYKFAIGQESYPLRSRSRQI